jgi:hypothetical protein
MFQRELQLYTGAIRVANSQSTLSKLTASSYFSQDLTLYVSQIDQFDALKLFSARYLSTYPHISTALSSAIFAVKIL